MSFTFAAHVLITPEELSEFVFGVDDASVGMTTQQVASVNLMVGAISRQIIRHVGSNLKEATYTEVWDGAGSDELVPRERPIVSVSSIKFAANGQFGDSSVSLPAESFFTDGTSIKLRSVRTPSGRGLVQAVYVAGYDTVPEDIKMAHLLQFQWAYKQIGKGDAMVGIKQISKMQESQTKDDTLAKLGLRSEVVGLLEPYIRFEAPLSIMFTRTS